VCICAQSAARLLHESPEHSGDVLAVKLTASKPASCFPEGRWYVRSE